MPRRRLASLSSSPTHAATSTASLSAGSTAPPGKTCAPPANAIACGRRTMSTSKPRSASRATTIVAAGRIGTWRGASMRRKLYTSLRAGGVRRPLRISLVRVHARLLDDRRPLVDLALHLGAKRVGPRLVRRHRHCAELVEPALQSIVLDCGLERGDELVDHRLRRPLRGVQAVPDAELELGQAGFLKGRNVGQRRKSLGAGDAVHLELAGLDV